ncbi:hypothetical protein FNF28_05464 [Cafeteria roenbergensis]|uniref:Uncharacterized protein n=1 Tax=Cafeteria roenbergensis TaxID=33653 RepID=A0A5A8D5C1_CAFRO|nr:hypothetical protein FNF28_05464 [Cafeteria roenbergensis]
MAAPSRLPKPIDLPWKCHVWSAELLPEGGEVEAGPIQVEVFLIAPVGAAGAPSATLLIEVDPSEPKFVGITLPEEWVTAAACEVTAQWKPTLQERGCVAAHAPETTGALWRRYERAAKDRDSALEAKAKTHARSIQLSADVARLTVELEALRELEHGAGRADELRNALQRVESLELQLGQANASITALRERARSAASEGTSRASAQELAVKEAEDKVHIAHAEASALRVQVRQLEASLSESEAAKELLQRQSTELRARVAALECDGGGRAAEAEAEAKARSEQSCEAALRFQSSQLEDEVAQLRRQLSEASEGAAAAMQKESEAQQALMEQAAARQRLDRRHREEVCTLREQLDAAMRACQEHKDAAMAARLEAARAPAPAAAAAGPDADTLARELASAQERLRIANRSIDDLRSAARRAEVTTRDHMETIDSLTARLFAASDEARVRPPAADTAGDRAMAHDQAELEQLRPRVQTLRAEVESLRAVIRSLRQTMAEQQREAADRTSELMARLIQAQEADGQVAGARPDLQPAAAQPNPVPVPPPPAPGAARGGNRAAFEAAVAMEQAEEERRRAAGAAAPRDG